MSLAIAWMATPSSGTLMPINYTFTYDGTTSTISNHADSEFILTVVPLIGDNAGTWYGVQPGNSVTVDSAGQISGTYSVLPGCPGGDIASKETVVIHCWHGSAWWEDKTAEEEGTLIKCESKTFPADHKIWTKGCVKKSEDYEETLTEETEMIWHPDLPQLIVDYGWSDREFAKILTGSVSSYNETHMSRHPIFNDIVAVGVPEPTTVALLSLGALLLLRRRRA